MRGSAVAWVCCVLPVFAGCHAVSSVSQTPEVGLHQARRVAEDQFRQDAQAAWDVVSARHPQRAFSDEFRDGFVDGHTEFCNRGAACEPPPVPPVPYDRYKKFFGRGGNDLVRDYYLGFQYGADTAAAPRTLWRESAPQAGPPKTLDMPTPKPPSTGKFGEPRTGSDAPPAPLPLPSGSDTRRPPPLPKPELPVIKPFDPDLSKGGKFAPVPSAPDRLPPPFPPLPVTESPVAPPAVSSNDPMTRDPRPVPIPVLKIPLAPEVGSTVRTPMK